MTREKLFDVMAAAGMVSVHARYWSGSDEGTVEDVAAYSYSKVVDPPAASVAGKDDDLPLMENGDIVVPATMYEAIADLYIDTVYDDSTETYGILVFDVLARTVTAHQSVQILFRQPAFPVE